MDMKQLLGCPLSKALELVEQNAERCSVVYTRAPKRKDDRSEEDELGTPYVVSVKENNTLIVSVFKISD